MSDRSLRIQSVPAEHAYVRHCLQPVRPGLGELTLLPDPPVPGAAAGQWWPSPVLDPGWLTEGGRGVDVVHLHFGFEHRSAAELEQWCAALDSTGVALALTVHDLANPHLIDQRPHLESLGVLVPRAKAVLTLTHGAAAEIGARWGVTARVLPHPHVVPLDQLGRRRPRRPGPTRYGVPMGALRANVDPLLVPRLLDVLPSESEIQLDLRPGRGTQLVEAAGIAARVDDPRLRIVERAAGSEHEFADRVAEFDVLVLPYRHGTHSGWVEAAYDIGVPVVAPAVGYWHEQHPLHRFELDDDESLAQALQAAAATALVPAPASERLAQRHDLLAAHSRLYRRLARAREGV